MLHIFISGFGNKIKVKMIKISENAKTSPLTVKRKVGSEVGRVTKQLFLWIQGGKCRMLASLPFLRPPQNMLYAIPHLTVFLTAAKLMSLEHYYNCLKP